MVENGLFITMPHPPTFFSQRMAVVASVLLLHGLALWALQSGLLHRMVQSVEEMVIPIAFIAESPLDSKPRIMPAPAPLKNAPVLRSAPPVAATIPAAGLRAPASPVALADPAPSANAPVAVAVVVAPPAVAAPATVGAAAAAVPKVELPSSSADYLHNPRPEYPRISERRNEQGTVILHVLVGVDGRAQEVSVKTSSGFDRLDQAAREAVLGWTFVPGKRNGAAVEMAVDVPIRFKPSE